MNLDEFIKLYDDTYVEVGGSANALNQCVDLANAYIMEVLGKEPIFGTNAKDFWTRADDSYERWGNPSVIYPQKGDLVIWNIGSVGHIAIATGIVNNGKFQTFSQNYPLGSFCHLVDFNMNNLIGYLRPKGENVNCFASRDMVVGVIKSFLDYWWTQFYNYPSVPYGIDTQKLAEQIADSNIDLTSWMKNEVKTDFFKHFRRVADAPACPPCDCTTQVKAEQDRIVNNLKQIVIN